MKAQAGLTVSKIKFLTSEVAIKYMEEELIKTESEIAVLAAEKAKVTSEQPTNIGDVMQYEKYFLEHLEYLLLQQINPVAKAGFFSVLFDKAPTYEEILSGTASLAPFIDLNRLFVQKRMIQDTWLVRRGSNLPPFDPRTRCNGGTRIVPNPLDSEGVGAVAVMR